MNVDELKLLQSYPLWMKIEKTKQRIREFYEFYNGDVYISFSGGKDSTVLLNIARQVYEDIEGVFCDTGLEYPEIREFVKKQENITWIKPKMTFKRVIEERGYPIISKSVANCVRMARKNIEEGKDTLRVRQIKGLEKGSKFNKGKWEFLLDAPFKISDECCNELKKKPFKEFQKITSKKPIIGILADEGMQRQEAYLKTGCNSFREGFEKSQPLGFWTEQDILEYIYINNLEIADVYGKVKLAGELEGQLTLIDDYIPKLELTGVNRTGCIFCMFGLHIESYPNRFQQMKITHPKQYAYCINNLGLGKVLDYINIEY